MADWPPRHAIARARFFLAKAESCTVKETDEFEAYLDAAIVFGRTALLRVESQYKRRPGWKPWWNGIWTNESVQFLQGQRNYVLHQAPSKIHQIVRQGDGPTTAASLRYFESADVAATTTVGRHIDETEALVREADERFWSKPAE